MLRNPKFSRKMPKPKRFVWRIKQRKTHKAAASSSSSAPPPPPPPPPSPPWVELPPEITSDILRRLGAVEILLNAQRVCTTWWKACHDPTMWRVIDMPTDEDLYNDDDLDKLCRVAVDRSHGQLSKISIEYFGEEDLLEYVALRSSQLRHLRLVSCDNISLAGLGESAKNFPLLEELHIYLSAVSTMDIEAVGRSCSQLKSFTLNDIGFRGLRGLGGLAMDVNDQALAIAANMPGLRHLALFGNAMTNEGLCAILDGCPCLESLDLRHCYSIDLKGDLGTRCRQQIIDLKLPHDSTHGYEFGAQICDCNSDDVDVESDRSLSDYFHDYYFGEIGYDEFNAFGEYLDDEGFLW